MPFSRSPFSGFPFDRSSNRDENLRSTLDDIAKRHPELAEHLDPFTHRAGVAPRAPRLDDEPEFDARFERPFGDDFPFAAGDRERLDPDEIVRRFYRPRRDSNETQGPSRQDKAPPPTEEPTPDSAPQSQSENVSKPRSATIQQSNTIDLGQKQEAVDDRNQRSMSAPPADKGQRYTSSINIPVNQPADMADQQQSQESKPVERIIPIQIEGRDEPVIPRKSSSAYAQPPRVERIFGQRPEQFTQYLNRDPRQFSDNWPGFSSEEPFRKQAAHAERTQSPARPAEQSHRTESPRTSAGPQAPDDRPHPAAPAPPPAPENKPPAAIEQIQVIQKDVSALMEQAHKFSGKPRDKQYLYLDEMLTRNLIKLDNIDTQGQDIIRSSRKEAIKCIEKAIGILETKAAMNQAEMEAAQKTEDTSSEEKINDPEPAETSESEAMDAAEPCSGQERSDADECREKSESSTDFVLVVEEKENPGDAVDGEEKGAESEEKPVEGKTN